MSGPSRKLLGGIPAPYAEGVGRQPQFSKSQDGKLRMDWVSGADEGEVAKSADRLHLRMEGAVERWRSALGGKDGTNQAIGPLDEVAEHVRRAAIESKDSGGAVIADVASALLRLSPDDRMTVLRRAGRPEIFEPLLGGGLPDPPKGGIDDSQAKANAKELAKAGFSRSDLPLSFRPSAMLVEPDKYSKRGNEVKSAKTYKEHLPKDKAPLDVKVKRGERGGSDGLTDEDIEYFGVKESGATAQRRAVNALAGDQIGQVKKIEKKYDAAELPPVNTSAGNLRENLREAISLYADSLPKGVYFASVFRALGDPRAAGTNVTRARKWLDSLDDRTRDALQASVRPDPPAPPRDSVVSVGTSTNPQDKWSGRSGLKVDQEVARRNRGAMTKIVNMLYEMTAPVNPRPMDVPTLMAGDDAAANISNKPLAAAARPNATIDLDRFFPWWRGRFAVLDENGQYTYPGRLPSAEWLTGMIQGMYSISDPDFEARIKPLIQRSINAAADEPTTPRARAYEGKAFLLSEDMEEAMRAGVGSRDYPYSVYGDREVPRASVSKPLRTFKEQAAAAGQAPSVEADAARAETKRLMQEGGSSRKPKKDAVEEAREKVRRLMQSREAPGTGDQSSIYTVRPDSPFQLLLA
jgi:hypothetical protein